MESEDDRDRSEDARHHRHLGNRLRLARRRPRRGARLALRRLLGGRGGRPRRRPRGPALAQSSSAGVDIIAYSPRLSHLYVPGARAATMTLLGVSPTGHPHPPRHHPHRPPRPLRHHRRRRPRLRLRPRPRPAPAHSRPIPKDPLTWPGACAGSRAKYIVSRHRALPCRPTMPEAPPFLVRRHFRSRSCFTTKRTRPGSHWCMDASPPPSRLPIWIDPFISIRRF